MLYSCTLGHMASAGVNGLRLGQERFYA